MVNYCAVFVPDGGFEFFSRLALRLAGLRVHRRLRTLTVRQKARQPMLQDLIFAAQARVLIQQR